jgi:hypothetical protein
LEAELNASRKAFDAATAAKVSAEKSTKSALTKAKKAEKALADANKEHLRLLEVRTISCYSFACFLVLADIFFFCCFLFPWFCRVH